jgi:iron complex transport system substrate-binding protein
MKLLIAILLFISINSLADEQPMRIVSAGASVTEILFALDHGNNIVAVDNTSVYPEGTKDLPKLGYFRQLSSEGVLSQMPTHLLGAAATGPASLLSQLEAAHIDVTIFSQDRSIDGLYAMITAIGAKVNASAQAQELNNTLEQQISAVKAQATHENIYGLKALYIVANNDRGLTVAGKGSLPNALFNELGIVNIAQNISQYKVMDNEHIMLANPDMIFVASHAAANQQGINALCNHPAIKTTSAGQHCNIQPLNSSISLGLSPRIPNALQIIVDAAVKSKGSSGSAR